MSASEQDDALSAEMRSLVHRGLVYRDDAEFVQGVLPFVREGIERGEAVSVVGPHADAVRQALGAQADAVDFAAGDDWFRVPAWTIASYARLAQRSAARGVGMRAVSEVPWATHTDEQAAEWMRYESLLNHALGGTSAQILCTFDEASAPTVLEGAHCTHPSMTGSYQPKPTWAYLGPDEYAVAHPSPSGAPVPPDAPSMRFGATEIPAVRRATLRWATGAGWDDDAAQELLIAVYEVASNAVEHGGGAGVIHFWSDGSRLCCEVRSSRPVPDVLAGYAPPSTSQERGRGLWLARQICDLVEIRNDGDGATVRLCAARHS